MTEKLERLREFIERYCLVQGEAVKLASGRTSNFYVDCRIALMDPRSLPLVAELVHDQIRSVDDPPIALGGTVVGAVPITAAVVEISAARGWPLAGFMVRKEVKPHGMQKKIENAPGKGARVAIVEDVITTGGSTLAAIDAAEEAGLEVTMVVPIVDRGEGGAEAIRKRLPQAIYAPLLRFDDFETLRKTEIRPTEPV
ncbi:MAG TPA: orotate phosphoribosyltransferase [Candidatus Saccharimonadales bacterium]|nr:orotate phosphoribosyltransferase [Candidatus Saccharimonadales bacterium]